MILVTRKGETLSDSKKLAEKKIGVKKKSQQMFLHNFRVFGASGAFGTGFFY
jgi:hypothetical protein